MLQWINTLANGSGPVFLSLIMFFVFISLSIFFQYSRKMNAQAEPAEPAVRPLTQLAKSLQQKKPAAAEKKQKNDSAKSEKRNQTAALLKRTDELLYDKLQFLPDARTGRNLNFFWLAFVAVLVAICTILVLGNDTAISLTYLRDTELGANPAAAAILTKNMILVALFSALPSLACFLIRKNREFYIDIFALYVLIYISFYKLFICTMNGCCMGIEVPWGIHSSVLQTNVFPIQITEFTAGAVLSVLCILFMLRSKHYRPGRGASAALLAYAVPRFFWKYLRYHGASYRSTESQAIFLGLSMTQLVCAALILIAIVWLFVLPLEKKLMDKLFDLITRRLPWYKQPVQTGAPEPVPTAKGDGKT